ncbi:MAG: hypothetical protein AAFP02_10155, partial [Bacteroidota bacterium]
MSSRRNNSSSIVPFIFVAVFFAIASQSAGPIVFGFIAYALYKMFSGDSERQRRERRERRDYERGRRPGTRRERRYEPRRPTSRPRPTSTRRPTAPPSRPKANPFKVSGIKKYKDYDYEGAIEDFKKALSVDS